jgi:YHS domain-containing protein
MRLVCCGLVVATAVMMAGCSQAQQEQQPVAAGHAQCLVCKYNADLACVDLKVDATTPRAEFAGKTYYFCSEECRDNFLKSPGKYVASK